MIIRPCATEDGPSLVVLWERSVRATHSFLREEAILYYRPLVRDVYLPQLEVWVADAQPGRPEGFIGLDAAKVEMLFVDADRHGRGTGRLLLDHARNLKGPLAVDVNEQNPGALAFYRRCGFVRTGRSALDGEGHPFPLIHMAQPA